MSAFLLNRNYGLKLPTSYVDVDNGCCINCRLYI